MHQTFCILGSGGERPAVYKLQGSKGNLDLLALSVFPSGESIYRVALSPTGKLLAAATKSGNIKVFNHQDEKAVPISEFQYRTTMPPHVTGLTFADDNIVVVAGTDAKIRVLDIKTKERLHLVSLPGIAFGLNAINQEFFSFICRQGGTDHLMVWSLKSMQKVFEGPGFKINSEYLLAPLVVDDQSGYLAHSDRMGVVYLYDINQDFQVRTSDTGHGEFYGLLLHEGHLITGGYRDNGKIRQWSAESLTITRETPPLLNPVMALSRFDADHFLTVTAGGKIVKQNYQTLDAAASVQINNVRHTVSLPVSVLIKIKRESDRDYVVQKIDRIKALFEMGNNEEARSLITELGKEGYDTHALKVLALAEKAQGLLLDEMETLMKLLHKQPQGDEYVRIMERLVEILEQVHEPEMAVRYLNSLIEEVGKKETYYSKMEELQRRCIPEEAEYVLLTGFSSMDMIKPEFRKAEIFDRKFQNAISWEPEKITGNLSVEIQATEIVEALASGNNHMLDVDKPVPVTIKAGRIIAGPVPMIRVRHRVDLPDYVEIWLEVRKGIDENKLVLHKVFYPHADEYGDDWNYKMLNQFERMAQNPDVNEWFDKTEKVVRAAIVSFDSKDDEDDFFTIHRSR